MGKNNARLENKSLFMQAGIDTKTGLPLHVIGSMPSELKQGIKKQLRILDEQNAVNRYVWYNLPAKLSSQELERLLYYKGQLCFFYCEPLEEFYFMPYALDGSIDFYGRFNTIHPVPIAEGTNQEEKNLFDTQNQYLSTLKLKVHYDIPLDELTYQDITSSCVLLHDYSKQLSQTIIARQIIQEPLLDFMSECIPLMRTGLKNSTGVQAMRVGNQDEASNVKMANLSIDDATLKGQRLIPVIGQLEFQDLAKGDISRAEEYLMAMQSLDNFRMGLYGLKNGGLFSKNQYQNQMEISMNSGQATSPLQDGLTIRQRFCDIVNSIWGLGISCEIAESEIQFDTNGDGYMVTDNDQSGIPGEQDEVVGGMINDIDG